MKNFHQKHNKFHQDLTSKILNSQFHSTKSNKQLESKQVRCYLRNDVKRIEKKLQSLSSGGHLRSLPQAILDGDKRDLDGSSELLDLVAELDERGPHSDDDGVDVDELGAEVDEIGVVAVDEVDELVVEGGEVAVKLGAERVEGDEGSELRNVGFGVEVGGEKRRRFEPQRVGVQRIREEFSGGSWWRRDRIRHFRFARVCVCLVYERKWIFLLYS